MKKPRIKVSNEFKNPITLWLEPWGEDYGMLPDDEFEIVGEDADEDFFFHIVFGEDIKVFVESIKSYATIWQKGQRLECGHNRFWDKEQK